MNGKQKEILMASLVLCILTTVACVTYGFGFLSGYNRGHSNGYVGALVDIKEKAQLDFSWTDNGDGTYEVHMWRNDVKVANAKVEVHVLVGHYRSGTLLSLDHHAGVVTTIGLNWIEDQLGDSPSTSPADYISCSNNATSPSAAWTQIPDEIAANGLTRAQGTYASTGDGTWTIEYAFSVTGTQSVRLYGLQYGASGDNNLLCSDTSSVKNCENGDTLTVTWTITVT